MTSRELTNFFIFLHKQNWITIFSCLLTIFSALPSLCLLDSLLFIASLIFLAFLFFLDLCVNYLSPGRTISTTFSALPCLQGELQALAFFCLPASNAKPRRTISMPISMPSQGELTCNNYLMLGPVLSCFFLPFPCV